MRRSLMIVLAIVLIAGVPCLAQTVGSCTPAGTWFGGQDNGAKYLLTIVPSGVRWMTTPYPRLAVVYTIMYQAAFKPRVTVLTQYTGELVNERGTSYRAQIIAMVNQSDLPPGTDSPSNTPQLYAIRERGDLTDCNTLNFVIDFFVISTWSSNLVPFKDTPDSSRLAPGAVIKETYHRMPTDCPQCPGSN